MKNIIRRLKKKLISKWRAFYSFEFITLFLSIVIFMIYYFFLSMCLQLILKKSKKSYSHFFFKLWCAVDSNSNRKLNRSWAAYIEKFQKREKKRNLQEAHRNNSWTEIKKLLKKTQICINFIKKQNDKTTVKYTQLIFSKTAYI